MDQYGQKEEEKKKEPEIRRKPERVAEDSNGKKIAVKIKKQFSILITNLGIKLFFLAEIFETVFEPSG